MWIWYEETADGLVIARLYGEYPEVVVPEEIDGKSVIGLGAYAFSEKEIPTDGMCLAEVSAERSGVGDKGELDQRLAEGSICALAGDFITCVTLPDSLRSVGELCFYQCRELREISFGGGAIEIGSDAFMNCRSLSTLRIRAGAEEPTALRSILNQRTQATDVWFTDAVVHFPEYQEKYDLIGPAHIFELNIEGEGFRARKCFDGDRFSLAMYDEVFRLAMEKEDERTLCRMAALRLSRRQTGGSAVAEKGRAQEGPEQQADSPTGRAEDVPATEQQAQLKEEDRERYQSYLLEHIGVFCEDLISRRDLGVWEELYQQGLIDQEHKSVLLKKLTEVRWIEGTRQVLGMG